MKNLMLTFALLFSFSILSFAQVQYNGNVRLNTTKIKPQIKYPGKFIYKPNCPDLAAVDVKFQILNRYTRHSGKVRISGVVKNVGSKNFVSNPRQMSVVLYEEAPGGRAVIRARQSFGNIPAGRTVQVSFTRTWYTSTEFPPNYRVCVIYDPDIKLDSNPQNDDCRSSNNCKTPRGSDINKLFYPGS